LHRRKDELTSGSLLLERFTQLGNILNILSEDLESAKASIDGLKHDFEAQTVIFNNLKSQKSYH